MLLKYRCSNFFCGKLVQLEGGKFYLGWDYYENIISIIILFSCSNNVKNEESRIIPFFKLENDYQLILEEILGKEFKFEKIKSATNWEENTLCKYIEENIDMFMKIEK